MKALVRTLSLALAAATVAGIAVAAPPAADKAPAKPGLTTTMAKHMGTKKHHKKRAHKKHRMMVMKKKGMGMKAPAKKMAAPKK